MSILGIVVLAMVGGVLLAALVALVGYLAYTAVKLRAELSVHEVSLNAALTEHRAVMKAAHDELARAVAGIHGDELALASRSAVMAAQRIERAALGFAELAKAMLNLEGMGMEAAGEDGQGGGQGGHGGQGGQGPDGSEGLGMGTSARRTLFTRGPLPSMPPNAYAQLDESGEPFVTRSRVAEGDAAAARMDGGLGIQGLEVDE
jgi:hypothetical protein